jgi:hypothetical protein
VGRRKQNIMDYGGGRDGGGGGHDIVKPLDGEVRK